jgi:Amt family ammonium transporter
MARSASQPQSGAASARPSPPLSAAIEAVLRRVLESLDASAVGVLLPSADTPLYRTDRLPEAALTLAELARHSREGLFEQARAAPEGVIGTNRLRARNDGPVCAKLLAVALRDVSNSIVGLLVALRTVEQEKFGVRESELLSDHAAQHASLFVPPPSSGSGLLTWAAFSEFARAAERTAGRNPGCLLYANVDQLHVLNKLAGLAAGDQAIAAAGEALQEELPTGAGVCHISGDRFALYLPESTLAQARRVAELLSRNVTERCANIGGLRTRLSISFGVAEIPPGDNELTHTLAAAEAACRAAKDRGRGRVEVYQDADQSIVRRNDDVLIASRLRKALETERIGIVAQPLISLRGQPKVEYYELLVRMVSDTGTFVSPTHFMSAAMRYQLLVDLDHAMLIRVFARLRAARADLVGRSIRFSINLSGPSIGNPEFLEWLSGGIGPDSIPGEWLQFEITETAAVANVSQTQSMIRRLRARGVEFALDDFGTGVSSLAYLKAFDVSMLKLDGSFTRDLLTDRRSESLVRGIAQLGQSMGIQTVAECVETADVRDRLTELGLDRAQGYLFGQPAPLEGVLTPERPTAGSLAREHPHAKTNPVVGQGKGVPAEEAQKQPEGNERAK